MVDITRILCPVDLSEFSRHALDHSRALATRYGAGVIVLHVFDTPQPVVPATGVAGDVPVLSPLDPEKVLEEVRRFCGGAPTPKGSLEIVVKEGHAAQEIVAHAEQLPTDLIVMGTHGRGGLERLLLGSVTEHVLRTTRVPVLTVPPGVEEPDSVTYKTILCAVEFSDPSLRALEYALSLAEGTNARLVLLHVIEGVIDPSQLREASHFSVPEYYAHVEANAMARLKAAVPDAIRACCRPEELVVPGKPDQEILRVASDTGADLIVMGAHGKGALARRLLLGSTTHRVICEAERPVLSLHGHPPVRADEAVRR